MIPIRDMFSAVFFVSVGLLIDPRLLVVYWVPIAVITLAVVVGQVFTIFMGPTWPATTCAPPRAWA